MLFRSRILITSFNRNISNPLLRFSRVTKRGLLNSIYFSLIWRIIKIPSTVNLLDLNPCSSSDSGTLFVILLEIILLNSLRTKLIEVMLLKLLGSLISSFLYIGLDILILHSSSIRPDIIIVWHKWVSCFCISQQEHPMHENPGYRHNQLIWYRLPFHPPQWSKRVIMRRYWPFAVCHLQWGMFSVIIWFPAPFRVSNHYRIHFLSIVTDFRYLVSAFKRRSGIEMLLFFRSLAKSCSFLILI